MEKYLFDHYLSRSGIILDIACAAGRMAIPLSSYTKSAVIGFDISFNQVREALHAARQTGANCFFFQSDMAVMALANQSIDYVFITYSSLGVLTTREERESAIKEIARVLKSDGVAFICLWNRLWPGRWGIAWAKWIVLYVLRVLKHNPHGLGNRVCWEEGGYVLCHYFTPWEARSLFEKFGFDLLTVVPFAGSWDKNRVLNNTWWTRSFGEGLYFVLTKLN
jgi:ubiquinone/menaquinone biosynthesis C-methylase UbiE